MTGGCNCGAVRFEVTAPLGVAHYCHCRRCQRRSGTAASIKLASQLALACPCGRRSTPRVETGGRPREMVLISAFDEDPGIRPSARFFTASAAPWEAIPEDGLPRFAAKRPKP